MAVPVLESFTVQTTSSNAVTSIAITTASDIVAGDLLIMLVGDDNNTGDSWAAVTGWTKKTSGGGGSAWGASLAVYWREGTGTEDASYNCVTTESTEKSGWMLRISGVDATSDPFDVIGSVVDSTTASVHTISGIITTVAECLAFYLLVADGGDTNPYSVTSGTGWAELSEAVSGGSSSVGACFGSKDVTSAGSTGDVDITFAGSADSAAILQFAIAPAGGGGPSITDVDGDEQWDDGDTGLVATGSGFV